MIERTPNDHAGGIVLNNFLYRNATIAGDAAIGVFDSPNTRVLHNTILVSGTYSSPIEYRFADTAGVLIANNLLDGPILARDGARATVAGNVVTASAALFVNASAGDLHLKPGASIAIDRASVTAGCPTDWDGEARPQGAAADVGADEYRAGLPPSAPQRLRIVR